MTLAGSACNRSFGIQALIGLIFLGMLGCSKGPTHTLKVWHRGMAIHTMAEPRRVASALTCTS